jgi:signal transduction histidine kinase
MLAADTLHRRAAARPRRALVGRAGRVAMGLAAVAAAIVSLRTSDASHGFSYLTGSATSAVIGLTAGWGLVAVGLETVRRWRRPRFGYLLAAAGIAWFLPEWADPAIDVSVGFTIGLALSWLYPALVCDALFGIAGTSRSANRAPFVVVGYALFVIGLGIVPALGFDPRAAGCGFCPPNLIDAGGSPTFFDGATHVATALGAVWSASAALVLAGRLARAGALARRVQAPIMIPGIAFLLLVAIALGRTIVAAVPPTEPTDRLLRLGQAVALVGLSIGVASEWFRARQSRARVARVVADLAGSPPIGGLRDYLATILNDPRLQLAYPVGNGVFADTRGRAMDVRPRDGRTTTPIVRDGSVVAVLEHDADVLGDPGEVDEVIAAARLGLEHERLRAEARAQLDALRAARRRIVEAGDARRKQLERDLHDGAQQNLIALSINLRFVERSPAVDRWIDGAAAELRLAMDDLRDVAHGIYPAVLGDEGFAAAVDVLAEASSIPMTIVAMVQDRFDPAIETAAYHVVADAARGSVGPLRISARRSGVRLTVEVEASEIPEHVADEIEDRVGAVDGSLRRARDGNGSITLVAEIPCGS